MECQKCGPSKDHDILFNCQDCGRKFCSAHNDDHNCRSHQGQYNPTGRFAIDLSQLTEFARQAQQEMARQQYQQREPTPEEYERFLRSNPRILTSGKESIDLLAGIALIAWVFGFPELYYYDGSYQYIILLTIIISPAFILHELAHKYMAIHYGKYARFTLMRQMAIFTFFAGLLGIPIAGPGATMILGRSSEDENGIFAAAGPFTNFIIASISIGLYLINPFDIYFASIDRTLGGALLLSAAINAILGLFNLIPVGALDGRKILNWRIEIWFLLVLINIPALWYSYPAIFG